MALPMIGQRLAMTDRLLMAPPCRTLALVDMERRVAFDVLDRNGHICLLLRKSASIIAVVCGVRIDAVTVYVRVVEWIV